MTRLGDSFRGYVSDYKGSQEWAENIGKLLLNFGALEIQTFLWLESLSADENEVINTSNKQFSWRLCKVRKLIKNRKFESSIESEMLKVWECSEKLAVFRNKIAHNPLVFSYSKQEPDGSPKNIGILSIRKSKNDKTPSNILNLWSLEELKRAVDAVSENVSNLTELYDKHLH